MPGKTINRKLAARACAMLSAVLLAASVGVGSTTAYLMAQAPAFVNAFLPGKGAALTIEKTVEHPFGDSYQLPAGLAFDFSVDLGPENANLKLAVASNGSTTDVTADNSGVASVTVPANGKAEVYGIPEGASVTVTEAQKAGFTEKNGAAMQSVGAFTSQGAVLAFTNVYSPAPTNLAALTVEAGKTLSGRDWKAGDAFEFVLERELPGDATGDTKWVEVDRQTLTFDANDPASTTVAFDAGKLSAIEATDAGEHRFRVSETAGSEDGMRYDSARKTFTVLVGDADMDGSLEVQGLADCAGVTWAAGTGADAGKHTAHAAFANVYRGITATIAAAKTVVDVAGSWQGGPSGFEIAVTEADSGYAKKSGAAPLTMTTDAGGNASLTLPYYEAGTRYYVVEEKVDSPIPGMSYDATRYGAEVSVAEENGSLAARVSYVKLPAADAPDGTQPETVSAASFENRYEPTAATVAIAGTKKLVKQVSEGEGGDGAASGGEGDAAAGGGTANGAQAPSGSGSAGVTTPEGSSSAGTATENVALGGGEFYFELYEGTSVTGTPLQVVANAADGSFAFDARSFDKVGAYHFTVVEQVPADPESITYDRSIYQVAVTVEDAGDGTLGASVAYAKNGEPAQAIAFTNVAKAGDPDGPGGGDDPDGPGGDDGDDPDDPGTDPDLPETGGSDGGSDDDGSVVPGGSGQGGTDLEQTGDETRRALALSGVLALASAVLGAVAFINLRRSRDAE